MEILGLFLGAISALMLAYPITGYPKSNKRALKQAQLENLRAHVATVESIYDSFPEDSQVARDYKRTQKVDLHNKFDPEVAALSRDIEELGPNHERRAYAFSVCGIIVFGLSFLVQLLAAARKTQNTSLAMPGIQVIVDSLGPFADATAAQPRDSLQIHACAIQRRFASDSVTAVVVVGRFDSRVVRGGPGAEFEHNAALAQARADSAVTLLGPDGACEPGWTVGVIPVIGGPRLFPSNRTSIIPASSKALSADRRVDVYGLTLKLR